MNERRKKVVMTLGVVGIIFLSIFVVTTQNQLSELKKKDEGFTLFANILAGQTTGTTPFEVEFKSLVTNNEGNVKYHWDFGDGVESQEVNPIHTYESDGSYICTLTITDSNGREKTDAVDILAKKNKPPVVTISINKNTVDRRFIPILPKIVGYAGNQQQIINYIAKINPLILGEGQIQCFAQVDDPEDDEIVSYEWKVAPDDGITIGGQVIQTEYNFNGSEIKVPELYTWRQGRYVVVLTVEDSAGNKANASLEFQVDKSTTETMRAQKLKLLKDGLNSWNIYLNSILGATVAAAVLKIMAGNGFIGINILLLLFSKYILNLENIDDQELYNQINLYLNKHPRIKDSLQNTLVKIQDKLEEMKGKYPDKAENIDGFIDTIELLLEALGLADKRPVVFTPYPDMDERNVDRNLSKVFITVNDPEGDPFNVRIHGDFVSEVLLNGQDNDTFSAPLITPLPANEEIIWHVNASTADGSKWTNSTYRFKTFYE